MCVCVCLGALPGLMFSKQLPLLTQTNGKEEREIKSVSGTIERYSAGIRTITILLGYWALSGSLGFGLSECP